MIDLSEILYEADPDDRLLMLPELDSCELEQLKQLFIPRRDGDVISKHHRTLLRNKNLVARWNGWNFLTRSGVAVLDTLKMLPHDSPKIC